jgi:hypothetical protein
MCEDLDGDYVEFSCLVKLTEENKMLREALSLVVGKLPIYQNIHGGGYMIVLSHDDTSMIKETLNISEL